MHNINITVREKIAVNPAQDRYVCGNSDYIVRFDFDAEWAAHDTKTARFITDNGTPYDQVFTGNECPVPIILDAACLTVGVFAGNLSTTTEAYVPCRKSILCKGGVPAAPQDDVYNQIMEKLNREKKLFTVIVDEDGNASRTYEELCAALAEGMACILVQQTESDTSTGLVYTYHRKMSPLHPSLHQISPTFIAPMEYVGNGFQYKVAHFASDGKVYFSGYASIKLPPVPADPSAAAYLRWNGNAWTAATIDDLKADLGLT